MTGELDSLKARLEALERENRRIFDEAQREADAVFAQYQLSQLLASGTASQELANALCVELVRLTGAQRGLLWMAGADGRGFRLAAQSTGLLAGPDASAAEEPFAAEDDHAIHAWASRVPGAFALTLSDDRPAAVVCLVAQPDRALEEEGLRVLQLARHELAVALRGALLREALDRERRELSDIVEGATDAILQVDTNRRVVRVNGAAERLLGRGAAELAGLPCNDALGCEAAGGHSVERCPLAEVMASGQSIAYRETDVRGADGAPLRVAGGYSRSSSPPDGPARATAILRDIRPARTLEELREGFVATVSHELRTPLALIKGYADTLLYLPLSPAERRRYIERIEQTTERLTALVTQILDITHLDADPLVLERAPARFESLVARLRGDLLIAGTADRLVANLPSNLPPVNVDAARSDRSWTTSSRMRSSTRPMARRSRSRPSRRENGSTSRLTTRAWACPRATRRSSSSHSTARETSGSRGSPAPAWASTSAAGWSRRTAGSCALSLATHPGGRARGSRCRSRPPPPAAANR